MRAKSFEHHVPKGVYDCIVEGHCRFAVIATDKHGSPSIDDVIDIICVNSKGLVEEFSPRTRRYVCYIQTVDTCHEKFIARELRDMYVVGLSTSHRGSDNYHDGDH